MVIRYLTFLFLHPVLTNYHLFIPKHNILIIKMARKRAINNPTRYLQLLIILVSD